MKNSFLKISCLTLLLAITSVCGCNKNVDTDISTTVTGIVSDGIKHEPIANVPIYIDEYDMGSVSGPQYRATIDSTKSDLDGKYNIEFSTHGNNVGYRVRFKPPENFLISLDFAILHVGEVQIVNFSPIELHFLKARLEMTDNPNPPMRVSTIFGSSITVWGTNNDTTVFLKVIPNNLNQITFSITNVDTPSVQNYQIDTIMCSGFQDTFDVVLPVVPESFPGRL